MATAMLHRPSSLPHFHVGANRWRSSLAALLTPLIPLLDANVQPWTMVFAQSNPVNGRVRSHWTQWLLQAQHGRCFWCQGVLTAQSTTVEHVLPYRGDTWGALSRVEQLLTLRVSHAFCNQAYAGWRGQQDAATLAAMDARMLHLVHSAIRRHPILQLYGYQQPRAPTHAVASEE